MQRTKQSIVDEFFKAFMEKDMNVLQQVMHQNATWYFLGQHPLAGVKHGIQEIVEFFSKVGKIMMESKPSIEKLIVAENENYLIECIHSKTNRQDENNLEHYASVLWTFKENKIIEGRHFFSDQQAIDKYFNALA